MKNLSNRDLLSHIGWLSRAEFCTIEDGVEPDPWTPCIGRNDEEDWLIAMIDAKRASRST